MIGKLKDYTVTADLKVTVGVTVKAASLEEALAIGQTMGVLDFVQINDDYLDGSLEITGVF